VKAITTVYAGHRFRSRLEARWAVILSALAIRWEYEPEGFETAAGWYLPDFYLPDSGAWCEVKPGQMSHVDGQKCLAFAAARAVQFGDRFRLLGPIPRRITLPALPVHSAVALSEPDTGRAVWRFVPGHWATGHTRTDIALAADRGRMARFEHGEAP